VDEEAITSPNTRTLWIGAAVTSVATGLVRRLNAVIYEGVPIWHLDPEARVLFPLVVLLPLLLFVFLGRWAWRESDRRNRPAKIGLVCGVLGVAGFVAFFLSIPIAFGGLALTLGLEGKGRARQQGRAGLANGAIGLGAIAAIGGASVWLLAGA
jgi:hypothetical protein